MICVCFDFLFDWVSSFVCPSLSNHWKSNYHKNNFYFLYSKSEIDPFISNMTIFSTVSVSFDLSFRWDSAWVCHELRTENEGICPTVIFIIFWGFLMFYQIFLSPQVKRSAILTYKHGIYKLSRELSNDLRLRTLGN